MSCDPNLPIFEHLDEQQQKKKWREKMYDAQQIKMKHSAHSELKMHAEAMLNSVEKMIKDMQHNAAQLMELQTKTTKLLESLEKGDQNGIVFAEEMLKGFLVREIEDLDIAAFDQLNPCTNLLRRALIATHIGNADNFDENGVERVVLAKGVEVLKLDRRIGWMMLEEKQPKEGTDVMLYIMEMDNAEEEISYVAKGKAVEGGYYKYTGKDENDEALKEVRAVAWRSLPPESGASSEEPTPETPVSETPPTEDEPIGTVG